MLDDMTTTFQVIENVETKTLEAIKDPNNKNLYLQSSANRRIYIQALTVMIIFQDYNAISELLGCQKTTVKLTKREKAFIVNDLLQSLNNNENADICKKVIRQIEALPETEIEMYAFSKFSNEKQAIEHFEKSERQMKESLTASIQKIFDRHSIKV